LSRDFYGQILKDIPRNYAETIGPKPTEWDITNCADIFYEKKD
jgi:hypothetical protein